jgi:hypothetical protein
VLQSKLEPAVFACGIFERNGLHKRRAEMIEARQVDELCDQFNVTVV